MTGNDGDRLSGRLIRVAGWMTAALVFVMTVLYIVFGAATAIESCRIEFGESESLSGWYLVDDD